VAAEQTADQKQPLAWEEEEELARRIVLADALNDARMVLEDLPGELLKLRDRWATVDALATAAETANEKVDRYKRSAGLDLGLAAYTYRAGVSLATY
jgi:hypothetical protein